MFSLHDIDHVAWFLVLLMGGWVVVNALVDLSGDRSPFEQSKEPAEERTDKRE